MGEESYCIDVVLFLQAPVVPSMGFHTAAVSARNQPYYLNQVNSQSTSSYYSSTPLFSVDRLLPRLSPLCFKCDEFVPWCDNQNLCDIPIRFYRRQRVRRAIGAIPSETIQPPSLSHDLGRVILSVAESAGASYHWTTMPHFGMPRRYSLRTLSSTPTKPRMSAS